MGARFQSQTCAGVAGAIGLIEIRGDISTLLRALGTADVQPGRVALRRLAENPGGARDADTIEVVVARWAADHAHIMPHAGVEVLRACERAIERSGGERAGHGIASTWARGTRPDADSFRALLDYALSVAMSSRAIDLLLEQPARWRDAASGAPRMDGAHVRVLDRLIHAPLVVAWGPPNVGKSALLNAFANDEVSIVSDAPGTTRDHVGVLLNLGGVAVRYADTPGVRPGAEEAEKEAIGIARTLIARADLVLWCRDLVSERPVLPATEAIVLEVEMRSDLGVKLGGGLAVSAREPESVSNLAGVIRERLVPREALDDGSPWPFWEGLAGFSVG